MLTSRKHKDEPELQRWQDVERFARAALIRGRWWLMAVSQVSFYGDESGSHGEGPFILGGYLGRDDTWSEVQDQWHSVLQNTGKPIDYFHMRECFKLEDQFEGFNRFQADKKLNALIDVLRPFLRAKRLIEFTAILDWEIYYRTIQGPLKDFYHNPYLFNLRAIEQNVAKYMERQNWESPAEFFFDDQTAIVEEDAAKQFYRARAVLLKRYSHLIGGIAFRNDQWSYPLQVADLIAWQRHRRELDLPADRGVLPAFNRLVNASEGELMRHREEPLARLGKKIDAGLRANGFLC